MEGIGVNELETTGEPDDGFQFFDFSEFLASGGHQSDIPTDASSINIPGRDAGGPVDPVRGNDDQLAFSTLFADGMRKSVPPLGEPLPLVGSIGEDFDYEEQWARNVISEFLDEQGAFPEVPSFTYQETTEQSLAPQQHIEADVAGIVESKAVPNAVAGVTSPVAEQMPRKRKRPTTALALRKTKTKLFPGQQTHDWRQSPAIKHGNSKTTAGKRKSSKNGQGPALGNVVPCVRCKLSHKKCNATGTLPCENCQKSSRGVSLWRRVCVSVLLYDSDIDPFLFEMGSSFAAFVYTSMNVEKRVGGGDSDPRRDKSVEAACALLRLMKRYCKTYERIIDASTEILSKFAAEQGLEGTGDPELQALLLGVSMVRAMITLFGHPVARPTLRMDGFEALEVSCVTFFLHSLHHQWNLRIIRLVTERVQTWISKGLAGSSQTSLWQGLQYLNLIFHKREDRPMIPSSAAPSVVDMEVPKAHLLTIKQLAAHTSNALSCFISLASEHIPKDLRRFEARGPYVPGRVVSFNEVGIAKQIFGLRKDVKIFGAFRKDLTNYYANFLRGKSTRNRE